MKTKLIVIAFILVGMLAQDSQAQIFGRFRGSAKQATCPTGGCPTVTTSQQGHWSFPGSIDSHLKSTHGVDSTGMQSAQKLNLHDSLHTGTVVNFGKEKVVTRSVIVSQPQVVQKFVPLTKEFTQAAFQEVVTGTGFRAELLRALPEARRSGKITATQAVRIRVAMISPAFAKHAEDLAVTQMVASGEDSDAIPRNADGSVNVAGINWEGLSKFLEAFIPLLLMLLKAFGLGA